MLEVIRMDIDCTPDSFFTDARAGQHGENEGRDMEAAA